jgi:hypothetical protein
MQVWVVPIESISNRYSELWNEWFPEFWEEASFIWGDSRVAGEIRQGDFLDTFYTHRYKAYQVIEISKMLESNCIEDGDVLFFHDLWFPLEQIFYMLDAAERDVKVMGFMHAGSYCPRDLLHRTGMNTWARYVEKGWLKRLDKVYVFSKYHERLLVERRGVDRAKVRISDFPYDTYILNEHVSDRKTIQVVFPGRPGPDRGWEVVDRVKSEGIEVVKTWGMDRKEYLDTLGKSEFVLSWPMSETYGVAVMEATAMGAYPIVPNRGSYPEFYPTCRSLEEAIARIKKGKTVYGIPIQVTNPRSFQDILDDVKRS